MANTGIRVSDHSRTRTAAVYAKAERIWLPLEVAA